MHCNSYIKDTKDFLNKLTSLNHVPTNSILVTMDVKSLYTNIDQNEGTEACFRKLETRKNKSIPSQVLANLILIVLKSNVFQFCTLIFQQIKGTAMGTPMAANYANLFMDDFECKLINDFHKKTGLTPFIWFRFIDDIFFIWTHGQDSLNEFLEFAQSYSRNKKMKSKIEFDIHQSTSSVNFLDVKVIFSNGTIKTDVYSKPTDAHIYLNSTSFHPKHVLKNIPKGQFIRLRRICSDTTDYIKHSNEFIHYFTYAGYDTNKLHKISQEVIKMKRTDLLLNRQKTLQDPSTTFVCTYHPKLESLPSILKNNYKILENDPFTKTIFPTKPSVAFRKSKTIQQTIVNNNISKTNIKEITTPCGKCKTCNIINSESELINPHTNRKTNLKAGRNCRTQNLIYAAQCKKHKLIYTGKTKEELRERFNKHRYDVKKRPENNELSKHCFEENHDFEKDITVQILEKNINKNELSIKEDQWICFLGTLQPTGLNTDTGLYAKEMYKMYQQILKNDVIN